MIGPLQEALKKAAEMGFAVEDDIITGPDSYKFRVLQKEEDWWQTSWVLLTTPILPFFGSSYLLDFNELPMSLVVVVRHPI